jgi:inner membrane protein
MGDFTEHVLFGFLAAAVLSYFVKDMLVLQPLEAAVSALAIVLGSVFPDIDHKNSYVHRAVKAFLSIGSAILVLVILPLPIHVRFSLAAAVFLAVFVLFSRIKMKHRGFTHTLSFCVSVASVSVILSVVTVYSPFPGIAAGVGLISHLLLDGELKIK